MGSPADAGIKTASSAAPEARPAGGRRQRRTTKENMLDPKNLLLGTDENGTRIKIFTATLTGEQALRAGVSQFMYTGDTIGADDPDDARPEHVEQAQGGRRVTSLPGATLTSQGQLQSGRVRHGHGEVTYDSGSSYVGQWKCDKREGSGKYVFACGDQYDGEWKAGRYHGKGTYTSVNSDGQALKYEGEWKADKMDGHGKYIYKSTGDYYEGGFVNGFREGFGKYKCANGDTFIGEYEGGELRSKTKLDAQNMQTGTDSQGLRIRRFTATACGERALKAGLGKFLYTGETIGAGEGADAPRREVFQVSGEASRLSDGRVRHGHGDITYDSGSHYVGEWAFDKRQGAGKFIFACGDVYDGQWADGHYDGYGVYSSAESDEYAGEWRADKFHGTGRLHYRDTGDVYVGSFVDGRPHGAGTYTPASYSAEYEDGVLVKKNGVPVKGGARDGGTSPGP